MGNFRKSQLKERIPVNKIDNINFKLVIIVYAYFNAQIKNYIVKVILIAKEKLDFIFIFYPKEKNEVKREIIIMELIK